MTAAQLSPDAITIHIHPDMHTPDWGTGFLNRVNPARIAELIAGSGFSVFWAFAKCHQGSAYYPTETGHQHSNLNGRDLLGEIIEALKQREIPCIIYYSVCSDAWAADHHPDWRQRNGDGQPLPVAGIDDFPWVCLNSPYREYALEQLSELSQAYPAIGLFLDRVGWAPSACYCAYCQRAFRKESGAAIPPRHQWHTALGRSFMAWRSRVLYQFLQEAQAIAKQGHPDWVFGHNIYSEVREQEWRGQWPERDTDLDDIVVVEAFGDYVLEWVRNTTYARALSKHRPVVSLGRFVGPMWDWTTKPRAHLLAQALAPLANGCDPMFIDSFYPDGSLDDHAYSVMAGVAAEIKRREEWVVEAEPLRHAAIHISMPTRLYYADDKPEGYIHDLNGAFKTLNEQHILTDMVLGRDMTADHLSAYRVLVLANTVCLSDTQITAIAGYVAQGGAVVATYETSLYDEQGQRRTDFGLGEILGVSYQGMVNYSSSFVELDHESALAEGLPRDRPMALGSPQVRVAHAPDSQAVARVVVPQMDYAMAPRRITWGDPPPGKKTAYPAIVTNHYGKGRTVYFAGSPERAYFRRGYPHCRQLLCNAIHWAADAPPPVKLDAGGGVKLTAFSQRGRGRLVVHLLNLQCSPGHDVAAAPFQGPGQLNWAYPIEEIVPARELRLQIAVGETKPEQVSLAPDGVELPHQVQDGWLEVTVPEVRHHAMVVVEPFPAE